MHCSNNAPCTKWETTEESMKKENVTYSLFYFLYHSINTENGAIIFFLNQIEKYSHPDPKTGDKNYPTSYYLSTKHNTLL